MNRQRMLSVLEKYMAVVSYLHRSLSLLASTGSPGYLPVWLTISMDTPRPDWRIHPGE